MKKLFFYGLAILLPCVITYIVVAFFLNLLTNPFVPITESLLKGFVQGDLPPNIILYITKGVILLTLLLTTLLVGALGQLFIIKRLLTLFDRLVHKIPMVSKIYKPLQDLIQTIFGEKEASKFSQVVLVPFPSENDLAIGMVTRHHMPDLSQKTEHLYSVFVPGTPNPSMGFMLSFSQDQLIFLDMDVKTALTFVISCGVVLDSAPLSKY